MDAKGIELDPRWTSSAENRFADARSRSWDPGNLQASRSVIYMLTTTRTSVGGKGTVFRYRLSVGENPVPQRKTAESTQSDHWGDRRARLFNPPPELLTVTLNKMRREKAKGLVLVPYLWETHAVPRLRHQADLLHILAPGPNVPIVAGARTSAAAFQLLPAEVGLSLPRSVSSTLLPALKDKWPDATIMALF